MSFRRLILLRHGETEFNRARRMQGHLDVVLTARGREQASRVAPVLAAKHPLAIVSSDAPVSYTHLTLPTTPYV